MKLECVLTGTLKGIRSVINLNRGLFFINYLPSYHNTTIHRVEKKTLQQPQQQRRKL